MRLNEQLGRIRKLMNLNEFIDRDINAARKYLSTSEKEKAEALPYEYSFMLRDFLNDNGIDFSTSENGFDEIGGVPLQVPNEEYDVPELLYSSNKPLFDQFAQWLYKKVMDHDMPIGDEEYPAWSFFDKPDIVKKQWLIHFTDHADSVESKGFTTGVDDYTKLGLTNYVPKRDKEYGGYNFAYTLNDFYRYGYKGWGNYKYGSEAVIFQGSGIRAHHNSDEEPQVIIYGKTAEHINALTPGDEAKWAIRSALNSAILYEDDDLRKVVDWFVKNYNQYRKHLH